MPPPQAVQCSAQGRHGGHVQIAAREEARDRMPRQVVNPAAVNHAQPEANE